jgi:sacsin
VCRSDALQVEDPQLQAKLEAAATALYSSLAPYVDDEDQMQLLMTNSLSMPCIWVGTGFAFPAVTALQAPDNPLQHIGPSRAAGSLTLDEGSNNSSNTFDSQLQQQQLLYTLPHALLQSPEAIKTLQALHVPQHWDFAAYAIALAVLAERSAGRALPEQELTLSLQIADAAAATQQGTSSSRLVHQDHVIVAANVLKVAAAGPGGVLSPGGPDLLAVPDADGVMAAPSELHFNDAAWLGAEGLRLAHAGLRQDTAEALGVRSMRWVRMCWQSPQALGPPALPVRRCTSRCWSLSAALCNFVEQVAW